MIMVGVMHLEGSTDCDLNFTLHASIFAMSGLCMNNQNLGNNATSYQDLISSDRTRSIRSKIAVLVKCYTY